jgi:hypothetical protein
LLCCVQLDSEPKSAGVTNQDLGSLRYWQDA